MAVDRLSPEALWSFLDGQRVLIPSGCAQPLAWLNHVSPKLIPRGVELVAGVLPGGYGFLEQGEGRVHLTSWHPAGRPPAGLVDVLPMTYSQLVPQLAPDGGYPVGTVLVHVTPPDADGWCSLGVASSYSYPLAARVPRVAAIMNDRMPRTAGARLHELSFAVACRLDAPLVEYRRAIPDAVDREIARHVARLIPDGATIQMGLGRVPEALPEALGGHRDLRLTAVLTDAGAGLIEAAAGPGPSAEMPGTFEFGEVMGSSTAFKAAAEKPCMRMVAADYLLADGVLDRLPGFVAVNSALQVDLTGQVDAESVGGVQVSGPGGHLDFMRAASRSPRGRSIVALRSVGRDGRSAIRRHLDEGSVVTTPRTFVTHVVTEHGIAELRGRTLRDRRRELLRVADPEARQSLSE